MLNDVPSTRFAMKRTDDFSIVVRPRTRNADNSWGDYIDYAGKTATAKLLHKKTRVLLATLTAALRTDHLGWVVSADKAVVAAVAENEALFEFYVVEDEKTVFTAMVNIRD